jgi:hypothetical protein
VSSSPPCAPPTHLGATPPPPPPPEPATAEPTEPLVLTTKAEV